MKVISGDYITKVKLTLEVTDTDLFHVSSTYKLCSKKEALSLRHGHICGDERQGILKDILTSEINKEAQQVYWHIHKAS